MEAESTEKANVQIKFDGEFHKVNIHLFTQILVDYATVVAETNKELGSIADLDITVGAPTKGSLNIDLFFEPVVNAGTIALQSLPHVAEVIRTVTDIYSLRQFFGKKGTAHTTENIDNDTLKVIAEDNTSVVFNKNTYNITMHNPIISDRISDTFKSLNNNPHISALKLYEDEDGHPSLSILSDDFEGISKCAPMELERTTKNSERTILGIIRMFFNQSVINRWQFTYNGIVISANISDRNFLKKVSSRIDQFGAGDCLDVDIEMTRKFDEELGVWVNVSYTITKVYEHIPGNSTTEILNLEEV